MTVHKFDFWQENSINYLETPGRGLIGKHGSRSSVAALARQAAAVRQSLGFKG